MSSSEVISTWVTAHPVLFTILMFPVVVTACLIVAGVCGLEFNRPK